MIGVAAILILGAGFFVMSKKQSSPVTPSETTVTQEVQEPTQEPEKETEVKEIQVEGNEFKFTPDTLTAKAGEKIRIKFKNAGKFPHDLVIDELNVKTKTIQPGEEDIAEFTAEKSGSFSMYCSVGNHRENGMEGKVTVE